MKIYTLEEIMSEDVDQPPKTLEKARRKFGKDAEKAYAWFYGDEALKRAKARQDKGRFTHD